MNEMIEAFKKSLENEKDEDSTFFEDLEKKRSIEVLQIKRLHKSGKFVELLEKAIEKYDSEEYVKRWYSRGIEPPETLFSFLFNYASLYGRDCSKKEYEKYGNDFTSELIFCNGYYFNLMFGQGTVILIEKAK